MDPKINGKPLTVARAFVLLLQCTEEDHRGVDGERFRQGQRSQKLRLTEQSTKSSPMRRVNTQPSGSSCDLASDLPYSEGRKLEMRLKSGKSADSSKNPTTPAPMLTSNKVNSLNRQVQPPEGRLGSRSLLGTEPGYRAELVRMTSPAAWIRCRKPAMTLYLRRPSICLIWGL
jgi:hypothetical protein